MPKIKFWIIIGLIIFFSAVSFLYSPLFLILSFFLIAFGVRDYIDLKPEDISKEEEILDSQEIPLETDQNTSNEVFENPDNPIRQSKAQAIKIKIKNEITKEEKKLEVIVVPEESVELKKETVNREESKEEEEIEMREKKTESFGGKINKMQGWGNKTPRKDLALIVVGIFLLLISSLVSGVSSISVIFVYLGTLFVGAGLYLILKRVLTVEQVIDNWGIMIKEGNGKAEEIFILAEAFMISSKAPSLKIHRAEMSPGIIRGILGTSRHFLVATDKNFRLNPYKIFINARDYGNNLDVSWYLTYRLPFWRALLRFIPFIGGASFVLESLDVFDRQDLTAYTTVCHYSILDAVGKIMMILNQDPSRIDRKSRGFLGIA